MLIDWLSLVIGGAIGLACNLAASYVYDKIKSFANQKISMEGSWAEYAPSSAGRQYSLGRIYFDKKRRLLAFDGTNYRNDGEPYCYWKTVASHIDRETQEFFYVFTAQVENQLDRRYYGFGVVNLALNADNVLTPSRGHYVSANVDDGTSISHSMIKADELGPIETVSGRDAIRFITRANPAT